MNTSYVKLTGGMNQNDIQSTGIWNASTALQRMARSLGDLSDGRKKREKFPDFIVRNLSGAGEVRLTLSSGQTVQGTVTKFDENWFLLRGSGNERFVVATEKIDFIEVEPPSPPAEGSQPA